MVFYRKYRPQTISELDSTDLKERLYSVLSSGSIPHAFLFTGPKGLGKTSTARIVAKAINCEARIRKQELGIKDKIKNKKEKIPDSSFIIHDSNSIEPCNQCEQCVSITNGSNLDVLEIDGASNRGIDEIRDLREKIRLAPLSAIKKVYIIDEVHMLTTEAFNALLKTLEEPPSHAMFIFCTTEFHKVPQTIVSRCFVIQFKKAGREELIHSLRRIAKGEKLEVEEEAFSLLAGLSEGSFRDGAKALEEFATFANGKKITKELVEEKYQIANIRYQIDQLLVSLKKKDPKEGLTVILKLTEQGSDIKYFIEQLLDVLHVMLLSEFGIVSEEKIENGGWKIEDIKTLVLLLTKAYQEIKYAVIPQLPLEMAIIEWSIGEEIKGESQKKSSTSTFVPTSQISSSEPNIWNKFIDGIKTQNHLIAGVLRGCTLKSVTDGQFVIAAVSSFHKDRLSEEKTRMILEEVASEITGKKVAVLVELKK